MAQDEGGAQAQPRLSGCSYPLGGPSLYHRRLRLREEHLGPGVASGRAQKVSRHSGQTLEHGGARLPRGHRGPLQGSGGRSETHREEHPFHAGNLRQDLRRDPGSLLPPPRGQEPRLRFGGLLLQYLPREVLPLRRKGDRQGRTGPSSPGLSEV